MHQEAHNHNTRKHRVLIAPLRAPNTQTVFVDSQCVSAATETGSKHFGMTTRVPGEAVFTSAAKSWTSFVIDSCQAGAPQYSQFVGKTVAGCPSARINRPV